MIKITAQNFDAEVAQSELPVLVDFSAPWCGPCKQMTPIIEELATQYEGKVKFVKINIEEAQELATQYMVMSIPSLILFKDGNPCEKKTGLISKTEVEKIFASYL